MRLTATVALIVRLASSASTSFTVHWLTTLICPQADGVLDCLHCSPKSTGSRTRRVAGSEWLRSVAGLWFSVCKIRYLYVVSSPKQGQDAKWSFEKVASRRTARVGKKRQRNAVQVNDDKSYCMHNTWQNPPNDTTKQPSNSRLKSK